MTNNLYEKLQFNNDIQLKTYLACEMSKLDNICPSNIFVHHVRDYAKNPYDTHGEQPITSKINSILKYGFKVSEYSSIGGTMMNLFESNNIDIDKILNYKFYTNQDLTTKILFAIPKYIKVKDKDLEFCSHNGKTNVSEMTDLIQKYKEKTGEIPCYKHFKFCILDAIKKHYYLPQEYILGFLLAFNNKDCYEFINPHTHLMYGGKESFDKHQKQVEEKVIDLYFKHGKNVDDIIISEQIQDMIYFNSINDI